MEKVAHLPDEEELKEMHRASKDMEGWYESFREEEDENERKARVSSSLPTLQANRKPQHTGKIPVIPEVIYEDDVCLPCLSEEPERRLAPNGFVYNQEQFLEVYDSPFIWDEWGQRLPSQKPANPSLLSMIDATTQCKKDWRSCRTCAQCRHILLKIGTLLGASSFLRLGSLRVAFRKALVDLKLVNPWVPVNPGLQGVWMTQGGPVTVCDNVVEFPTNEYVNCVQGRTKLYLVSEQGLETKTLEVGTLVGKRLQWEGEEWIRQDADALEPEPEDPPQHEPEVEDDAGAAARLTRPGDSQPKQPATKGCSATGWLIYPPEEYEGMRYTKTYSPEHEIAVSAGGG